MYLLYIDESDTSAEPGAGISRYFCLCGIRIVDSSYGTATGRLDKLLSKWPQSEGASFEVKGRELFQGEGPWKGVEPAERVRFCLDLASEIAGLNLKAFIAMKESDEFTADYQELLDRLIEHAARETAQTGSKTGRQLLVVFDRRSDFSVAHSKVLRAARASIVARHRSSCRFIDHGYEADSIHAPMIQLADFVAYFVRKQKTIVREATLLVPAHDARTIEAVDGVVARLQSKMTFVR